MTISAALRLVASAYGMVLRERRRLASMAAPWFAAAMLPALLLEALAPRQGLGGAALALIGALMALAGFLGFAFRWHRAMLGGETAVGVAALRIAARGRRFSGQALLVLLVMGGALIGAGALIFLPLTVAISALHLRGLAGMSGWLFQAMAAVTCGTVFGRLALALPAAALDESGDLLEIAWQRSRGKGGALCLGTLLSVLPFAALQQLIEWPLGRALAFHAPLRFAAAALAMVLGTIALAVVSTFFCEAHRALAAANGRDGRAPSGALPAR